MNSFIEPVTSSATPTSISVEPRVASETTVALISFIPTSATNVVWTVIELRRYNVPITVSATASTTLRSTSLPTRSRTSPSAAARISSSVSS